MKKRNLYILTIFGLFFFVAINFLIYPNYSKKKKINKLLNFSHIGIVNCEIIDAKNNIEQEIENPEVFIANYTLLIKENANRINTDVAIAAIADYIVEFEIQSEPIMLTFVKFPESSGAICYSIGDPKKTTSKRGVIEISEKGAKEIHELLIKSMKES